MNLSTGMDSCVSRAYLLHIPRIACERHTPSTGLAVLVQHITLQADLRGGGHHTHQAGSEREEMHSPSHSSGGGGENTHHSQVELGERKDATVRWS